jgi:hypothetical protein
VKALKFDMGLNNVDSKPDFLLAFPKAFLKLMTSHNNGPSSVQTVSQLLQYAQGYLNDNILLLKKHSILRDIATELNTHIQGFFRQRKQLIFELSNQERQLNQERKQYQTQQ